MIPKIQSVTGLCFGVFLILHLATTSSATVGLESFDSTIAALRYIYRPHIVVEVSLIVVAGSVHVGCALVQIVRRRGIGAKGNRLILAHRLSGVFLLLVVVGHGLATRVAPLFATGPTATGTADAAFLAYSLITLPGFFIPYYFALGAAGATHLTLGVALATKSLFPGFAQRVPVLRLAPKLAVVAVLVVSAGVAGIVFRREMASRVRFGEYRALYLKFAPQLEELLPR